MKLLSIGLGVAAAAILSVAAAGYTSESSKAAGTCVVSFVTHLKDRCPAGLTYMASAHGSGGGSSTAEPEPTITPTSDSAPCIKTLVTYHVRRCPG